MKKILLKRTALGLALGAIAPLPAFAATGNAELARQVEALARKVQELEAKLAEKDAATADRETDQRIRVLDRKLEIASEEAKATKDAAAKAKADADRKAKLLPTVYGRVHVALENRDLEGAEAITAGNAPAAPSSIRGLESYASRIGVRGEVELDSDLSAIYQAEYEINTDNGDKGGSSTSTTSVNGDDWAFSQRNTFAGLKSKSWGQIVGGKIDTPLKSAEGRFDQFNDQRGDIDYLIGGQNRANNIVIYSTPKLFELLTVNIAAIQPEGSADVDYDGHLDRNFGDAWSASIVADNGTLYGAIAYDKNVVARRSVDVSLPVSARTSYAKNYAETLRLVGGIKSGIWEGGVLLQRAEGQGPDTVGVTSGTPPITTIYTTNHKDREDTAYLVSGAVNVLPKVKLKAQYGLAKGDFTDEEGTLWALGADYNFTPKTRVFSYWSQLELDTADVKDKTLAVGLDHSF